MKKNKIKIIALSLASTLIISATGCSTKKKFDVKYNNETKQYELVGDIDYQQLNNCFIVELKNNELYLTQSKMNNNNLEYFDIYTKKCICKENESEVKNIIPFNVFVNSYLGKKDSYKAEDIDYAFDLAKEEYKYYIDEENVLKYRK